MMQPPLQGDVLSLPSLLSLETDNEEIPTYQPVCITPPQPLSPPLICDDLNFSPLLQLLITNGNLLHRIGPNR